MPYGMGRNAEFGEQAASLSSSLDEMRQRYAKVVQNSAYRPRSVLDVTKSGIGMSENDRSRQLMNGEMLPTPIGVSQSTYRRRQTLGLDSPYRSI